MSLLAPFLTPLRTLLFALGGVVLAWLWFTWSPWAPIIIVGAAWAGNIGLQHWAENHITTHPMRALALLEWRLLSIAAVSAGMAAIVIVLAVTVAGGQEATSDPQSKELIGAVGAALSAFVAAVGISAEDSDERVGNMVRDTFRARFVTDGQAASDQMNIDSSTEEGAKADRALNSSHDYGWKDWSRATRRERVAAVDAYLKASGTRGETATVGHVASQQLETPGEDLENHSTHRGEQR